MNKMLVMTRHDWRLWAKAAYWLLIADLAIRFLSFRRAQRWLDHRVAAASEKPAEVLERVTYWVNLASRYHFYRMTCLRRALVLKRLLAEAGVDSALKLGVRNSRQGFEAHAWVEYEGEPVGDSPKIAEAYAPLDGGGVPP